MIIAVATEQEHNKIQNVMERDEQVNVTFNKEKIKYKVSTVKFMGHVITLDGVKADEGKVRAIAEMQPAANKAALQ